MRETFFASTSSTEASACRPALNASTLNGAMARPAQSRRLFTVGLRLPGISWSKPTAQMLCVSTQR